MADNDEADRCDAVASVCPDIVVMAQQSRRFLVRVASSSPERRCRAKAVSLGGEPIAAENRT